MLNDVLSHDNDEYKFSYNVVLIDFNSMSKCWGYFMPTLGNHINCMFISILCSCF